MTDDSGQRWVSNIVLDNDYEMNSPSVAAFSEMLIRLNPAIRQGDQLSFVRITQQTNGQTGVPYIVVREYELIVDVNGGGDVFDFPPTGYIDSTEASTDCRLCVNNSGNAGGFALILSRTTGGKTYVSSQRIIVANNTAIINAYSGDAALAAAIQSYGSSDNAFLSSNTAEQNGQAPVTLSLLSATFGTATFVAGERVGDRSFVEDKATSLNFNGDIPSGSHSAAIICEDGDNTITCPAGSVSVSGSKLTLNNIDYTETSLDSIVIGATVTLDGGSNYNIAFSKSYNPLE
jgi:hypothetical protein